MSIVSEMEALRKLAERRLEWRDRAIKAEAERDHWKALAEARAVRIGELLHQLGGGTPCQVSHCDASVLNGHHCLVGHMQVRR